MIALITARKGSKQIPGKNVRLLAGQPLLCWSIRTALDCGLRPVVSSDSLDYLELAKRYGAEVLQRPESLAQDQTPHIEVIEHACQAYPLETDMVLFQPTAPLRKNADVTGAISKFQSEDLDSVIAVVAVPEEYHPDTALQLVDGRIQMASGVPVKHRIRRRQDHRPSFVPSGSLYVFKTRNLADGSFYGSRVGVYEVERTVNINDQADWHEAERLALTWQP